ncbi:CG5455 [Drosophila busckii]|uniref:CG5455 n=1 Tax=Drosophila busckii TaxID=30019 RepID=A0A0M4ER92_DROBS|nr:CG5455 [Drosophila busckii]
MFTTSASLSNANAIDADEHEIHKNSSNNKQQDHNEDNCSNNSEQTSIDEHYVFDIAMMSIAEQVPGSQHNELQIDRQVEEQVVSELVRSSSENALIEHDGHNGGSMRVVFGILVRLVLPLANGVARGIKGIRDVRVLRVLQHLASSRQALANLMAFAANSISLNLSSVQVSNRLGPLRNLLKLRKSQDGLECLPDIPSTPGSPTTPTTPLLEPPLYSVQSTAAKCCTLNILAEPPPGAPIIADIVFIHGLHGSLVNTWKQGLWQNERQPVEFDRPPRPPVRPPKRPRHSRSAAMHAAPREKRAKFASSRRSFDAQQSAQPASECLNPPPHSQSFSEYSDEDFAYVCDEPQDIKICEGIEYSFPTFRLRLNDNSRLLQYDLESMLSSEPEAESAATAPKANDKPAGKHKPSANDPNYSKCWPGDWLPLDCPGVRVIAVNYTTDPYLWRPLWKRKEPRSSLIQRSREMAELLLAQRVGQGHPIIYVGHSKGGLFIKQLIVDAWECGRPAMTPLWRSARGCFFYSVPHRGSHLASIKAPLLARSVELLEIEKAGNKYLVDLHRRFVGLYHLGQLKIEVFSFVETALTLMSVLYLRIVGVDSADPGIGDVCGIRLDHREICKPRGRDCILYKELVKMIKKIC